MPKTKVTKKQKETVKLDKLVEFLKPRQVMRPKRQIKQPRKLGSKGSLDDNHDLFDADENKSRKMVKNRNSSFGGTSHIDSSLDSQEF